MEKIDFNDVPVTIDDRLKEVSEFIERLREQMDWSEDDIDIDRKQILRYLEFCISKLKEHGLDLAPYGSQFFAFNIGELFAILTLWNRKTGSQWARTIRRARADKENAIMQKVISRADELWTEGDNRFHNKMAEFLEEDYNNRYAEEIRSGIRKPIRKSKIMRNLHYKSIAERHGRLHGVKKHTA